MDLNISLPDKIEERLKNVWGEHLSRKAAEALAVEGYRSGVLSDGEVAKMLELSINETDDFLKNYGLFAFENQETETGSASVSEGLIP